MTNVIWYVNESRQKILDELEKLPDYGRRKRSEIIEQALREFIEKHGDGNPQFRLEQFEDPNFIACPAFFRDVSYFGKYLETQSPEQLENFKNQLIMIDKKLGRYI